MIAASPFDLEDSPLKPVLDPRVFLEPHDKGKAPETTRQAEWVSHMHKHARGVLVFAIPNGTNIPSFAGRAKIKKEGLYTGFPDTGAVWGSGTAYLEWKDGDGSPSDAQIECLNRLIEMGYPCGVFRSLEAAVNWLASVGCPVRPVR
jgi:hypothetical protein